jgi:hypothetical protein
VFWLHVELTPLSLPSFLTLSLSQSCTLPFNSLWSTAHVTQELICSAAPRARMAIVLADSLSHSLIRRAYYPTGFRNIADADDLVAVMVTVL